MVARTGTEGTEADSSGCERGIPGAGAVLRARLSAVAVWGATLGDTLYTEFNNGNFAGVPVGQSYPPTGPSTEGAIASMLLHMGDGTGTRLVYNSGYGYVYYSDNAAFGHAQIASAVRDCSVVLRTRSIVRADGIDYLSYCLEKPATILAGPCVYTYASKSYCQQSPSYAYPAITQDERNTFAGLRDATQADAVEWQWGPVPFRDGFDQNARTVWMCNLFLCS